MPGICQNAPREGQQFERGQTMAEYTIVISTIVLIVIASLIALGNPIVQMIMDASDMFAGF